MKLSQCHNIDDLRTLARKKLPAPMFHALGYLHATIAMTMGGGATAMIGASR